jgi:hypothetical protein
MDPYKAFRQCRGLLNGLRTEGIECGLGAEVEIVPNQSRRGQNALAEFRLMEYLGLVTASLNHTNFAIQRSDVNPPAPGYR